MEYKLIRFITGVILRENFDLTINRPQTFAHGDWRTDNLLLLPNGRMGIINCGIPAKDSWFEFWPTVSESDHFCMGQIKGYFGGDPTAEYFPLFAFYAFMETTHRGYDTENILKIFDDKRNPVPKWHNRDKILA